MDRSNERRELPGIGRWLRGTLAFIGVVFILLIILMGRFIYQTISTVANLDTYYCFAVKDGQKSLGLFGKGAAAAVYMYVGEEYVGVLPAEIGKEYSLELLHRPTPIEIRNRATDEDVRFAAAGRELRIVSSYMYPYFFTSDFEMGIAAWWRGLSLPAEARSVVRAALWREFLCLPRKHDLDEMRLEGRIKPEYDFSLPSITKWPPGLLRVYMELRFELLSDDQQSAQTL